MTEEDSFTEFFFLEHFRCRLQNIWKKDFVLLTQVLTPNVLSVLFQRASSVFDLQSTSLSPNKSKSEIPYEDRGRHNNTEPVWIGRVAT